MAYHYKGRPALKCPFDIALYRLVLWDKKPGTVIEVASYGGGSALWLADQIRAYVSPTHVYSIDINAVRDVSDPGITFMEGDAENLAEVLDEAFMASLPRPLLVIEDSIHIQRTSLAVMEFMDRTLLRPR